MVYPPITFPVFGVRRWKGSCWLDFVEGVENAPAIGIWLAYAGQPYIGVPIPTADPEQPWLRIGSFATLTNTIQAEHYDWEFDAAFIALMRLVSATPLGVSDNEARAFHRNASKLVHEIASRHEKWPHVVWSVDGSDVLMRIFKWAGGWAAYGATSGVSITAAGYNVPCILELDRLTEGDGRQYHFTLTEGIDFPATLISSRTGALGKKLPEHPLSTNHIHTDQQLVMNRRGV